MSLRQSERLETHVPRDVFTAICLRRGTIEIGLRARPLVTVSVTIRAHATSCVSVVSGGRTCFDTLAALTEQTQGGIFPPQTGSRGCFVSVDSRAYSKKKLINSSNDKFDNKQDWYND